MREIRASEARSRSPHAALAGFREDDGQLSRTRLFLLTATATAAH